MVLGKIAYEVARRAVPYARGIVNSERMALNYAWKGYKHKSKIVTGLRGSLIAGGIAGGLINQSAVVPNVALPPFYGPSASKQNQARHRCQRLGRRYSNGRCTTNRRSRQSRKYKSYRSRYRR